MVGFFGAFFGQVPFRDLLFSEPRNNRSLFALQKALESTKTSYSNSGCIRSFGEK